MIVKIQNNRQPGGSTVFFDVPREVYFRVLNVKSADLLPACERSYIHWVGDRGETREDVLAVGFQVLNDEDEYETVYTNWTTYLLNNEGKTIERVFP